MNKKTTIVALCGLFTALAIVMSYIEFLIPFNFGVPGIKLGLANGIILLTIYVLKYRYSLIINIIRILIIALLFGNVFSLLFSAAGALLSLIVMCAAKSTKHLNIITVSILGAVSHNAAQIIIATILLDNKYIIYYLPVLIIAGIITGLLIGIITAQINKILRRKIIL